MGNERVLRETNSAQTRINSNNEYRILVNEQIVDMRAVFQQNEDILIQSLTSTAQALSMVFDYYAQFTKPLIENVRTLSYFFYESINSVRSQTEMPQTDNELLPVRDGYIFIRESNDSSSQNRRTKKSLWEVLECNTDEYEGLIQTIKGDSYEPGIYSETDYVFQEIIKKGMPRALVYLNKIQAEYPEDEHMSEAILHLLANTEYAETYPYGPTLVQCIINNKYMSVLIKDLAVQVFDHWHSKKCIPFLRTIEPSNTWLKEYIDEVLKELEENGN